VPSLTLEEEMRLLLAMFKHETNTFSPVPTPFERFFDFGEAVGGEEAISMYRGTGSGLGGFIDVAERAGAQLVVPIAAEASPSGRVDDDAYRRITAAILDEVSRGGYDGILLDLHGAMVTGQLEDGEGALLKQLRTIDRTTPVGVTLDMHANVYDEMVSNATVVTGYHTYPHIDMFEAGAKAADVLVRTIRGEVRPTMVWGNRPMLPHVMRQGTHAEPNRSLQARCIDLEQSGKVLAASVFVGFPHADIRNAGLSAVICTTTTEIWQCSCATNCWTKPGAARAIRLPAGTARAIRRPRKGDHAGARVPAGPLRQQRLGRNDGHDRRAAGGAQARLARRGLLRDLRPRKPPRWRRRLASARPSSSILAAARSSPASPRPTRRSRSAPGSSMSSTVSTATKARCPKAP
jgi:hypothetical protein